MAEAQHYIETIGIDQADTILAAVPMSHAYGYGMCLMVPLIANAAVATMRRFDPTLARQALRDYGVSVLPVAPVMLDLLLLGGHDEWCPGPQRVFSAGAPLPERTARAYHSRCGTVVRPLYGTTETGGISVVPPGYEVCHATSVGKPMRGVEVELVRVNGEFPETVGRLHVRSSSMMAGYLGRDELEPADLADGWFETGDLARIDASGAIHLTGRETDVINVFGMKVVPSEVEAVISRAPGVVEVKVYAGAHHSGSQIVKAAVVADGRFDTSIIRAYCERQLAAWKRPEIIVRVDSLPRSHNGKVIREQLP
jgi:acyl-coenzyme A synthetase/AMP-(fatty) acid ligase